MVDKMKATWRARVFSRREGLDLLGGVELKRADYGIECAYSNATPTIVAMIRRRNISGGGGDMVNNATMFCP